jgi:hypothetical protein
MGLDEQEGQFCFSLRATPMPENVTLDLWHSFIAQIMEDLNSAHMNFNKYYDMFGFRDDESRSVFRERLCWRSGLVGIAYNNNEL